MLFRVKINEILQMILEKWWLKIRFYEGARELMQFKVQVNFNEMIYDDKRKWVEMKFTKIVTHKQ